MNEQDRAQAPSSKLSPPCFVAVHIGAGRHSRKTEQQYKDVMKGACHKGEEAFRRQGTALDAVVAAITVLEDSEICNAGTGSNLTVKRAVECDASVMAGDGAFGAVGAVSGICNPVTAAARLACQSRETMLLKRVRPIFLVGDKARQWASEQGLDAAVSLQDAEEMHVTSVAKERWRRYDTMLRRASEAQHGQSVVQADLKSKRIPAHYHGGINKRVAGPRSASPHVAEELHDEDECFVLDTVGAVCVDSSGHLASGVSSGGIALKVDGRVGEAAVYGCGCFAQDSSHSRPGVACSVTGVGETIMRAGLARVVTTQMQTSTALAVDSICESSIRDNILDGQPAALPCPHKDCGILAVRVDASGSHAPEGEQSTSDEGAEGEGCSRRTEHGIDVEIGVASNSASMGFAFSHAGMKTPKCIMLRQGSDTAGQRSSYETFCCFGSHHRWDDSLRSRPGQCNAA